ncbi:hypothetical protein PCANC_23393 [Puccinia coronata f. sp. avenae]|uniref:Uncharacterized protein n=1 Tax=Puccinia coronata f. sp. avenae TaxID=200324 RepID=A0A2N5V4H1_9BASI|nr:hypothetical protein PCANC_23393 [Puccinia coronata f. sp. avenae]PLW44889.1 hypothetical protein PCASD_09139 [Puccinia coronata f. sp. avenae]
MRTPIRTPKRNGVQPLHAASERRAEAARPSLQAARHLHAFKRRAYGVQPCQTGVQSLHACLEGVQSLRPFGQACRLCTPVGSRKPLNLRGLREPAQASSAGTDLGAGTETRHQVQPPRSASK